MSVEGVAHVRLPMPEGRLEEARGFYGGLLGLAERAGAPPGSCWFAAGEAELRLAPDPDFHPAGRAGFALAVRDLPRALLALREAGVEVVDEAALDGPRRAHVRDPFGNPLELVDSSG